MDSHRGFGDEVSDRDNLVVVGVDERLNPRAGRLILNLNDVNESGTTVVESEELKSRRPVVVLTVEGLLGGSDGLFDSDGGGGRGQVVGLDERGAERDDLASLVESDVGDSVGEGDTLLIIQ